MTHFTKKRLSLPDSLGTRLRKTRKRRQLSLRAAELETKVALRHLEALENGLYQALPAPVYVRGFLTRYAGYLGLKPELVLAEYHREYSSYTQVRHVRLSRQNQEGLLRPHVTDDWLRRSWQWSITPEVIWGSALSLGLTVVLGYIWFQVASFAAAPSLEIVTPTTNGVVSVDSVEVAGVTDPTATLTINHEPVAVNDEGHFRQLVHLSAGRNAIEIAATNPQQKETTKVIQLLAQEELAGPIRP